MPCFTQDWSHLFKKTVHFPSLVSDERLEKASRPFPASFSMKKRTIVQKPMLSGMCIQSVELLWGLVGLIWMQGSCVALENRKAYKEVKMAKFNCTVSPYNLPELTSLHPFLVIRIYSQISKFFPLLSFIIFAHKGGTRYCFMTF